MQDQRFGDGATGEASDEVGAETEHLVVPPVGERGDREIGEVRVLLGKHRPDQRDVDRDLGHRHVRHDERVPFETLTLP